LANPVQKKSVEYNDNRLSRYVGQYGRCAVSGVELAIGDIHCHHIIPLGMGGTDEYSNLVIVSNDVHKLLHAKTPEVISYYSRLTNLNEAKFKKLNTLREKANLFPIL
jgi:CRISPR/Cas system Type II protein with McrA/HNH and RuvC-like nuclease domain